ncbi:transcriptional activator RfaH [Rhodobacteraceae bacterium 2376]|uniref:Transcription termination/antitermination protein NusG n=1 Tax=Rhabdonatronobacter sediminivivens TaxID=2743469 RepID=A0A7Z0I2X2_9RHOB|nr:transcriptional activator RfaH [Rhabdonatronobacter sediminivivens]NYS26845.1 transcriptional activator RfaH [Rhabdonatronobacter sediminivivens]
MSTHHRGTTWFLAQFKPNSHNIAERNLVRQSFRTFLPMQEETRRARGKFITQMRPLFPGYIFVALNLLHGGWRVVNSTYGIKRLVSLGKEPTPVPLDLVSQLMQRCDREGKLLPPGLLQPGDEVMLTKGPFADFVARIESIAPDRRVYLLMELMGAQTRVGVSAEHFRAISPSTQVKRA